MSTWESFKANEFPSNFLQGWDYLEHRFEALKIKRQQCKDRIRAAEALRVAWLKIGKLGVLVEVLDGDEEWTCEGGGGFLWNHSIEDGEY